VPDIRRRLGIPEHDVTNPAPGAIVACAIACLDIAGQNWTDDGGRGELAELYDQAVSAVRTSS
jgi:hypothetical protein